MLLVVDRNGIRAFNAYTMKPVCDIIRRDGSKIVDLVFSDLDRSFAIVSTTGKIERFELPSFKQIQQIIEDEEEKKHGDKFHYKSIDFVLEGPKDPN